MVKPKNDENEYRFIELDNKLKVLLVSDKSARSAVAVMDVRVGSWSDPIPGLSHFLEHMKFQGTNDYNKDSNTLDAFLADNQGSSNASTDS